MGYRKWAIRSLFIIIGLLSLFLAIEQKQWKIIQDILTKLVEFENGGLPTYF